MPPESSMLRKIARDPVARFLVLGALIFAVHARLDRNRDDEPIVVSSRFVEGLRAQHREQFGRAPSPSETEGLVNRFVREEALVREARALGLDRGDPIVRRRLVQKMELVLRGRLAIARPSDADVRRWIAANPDAVASDERFSFKHAFASRDRRGAAAESDAAAWATEVRRERDPRAAVIALGDAFALGTSIEHMTGANVADRFGPGFRAALDACPVGSVCGPIESRFGFHVVVMIERSPSTELPFAAARPIAERAILRAREDRELGQAIDALVAHYGVSHVEDARR